MTISVLMPMFLVPATAIAKAVSVLRRAAPVAVAVLAFAALPLSAAEVTDADKAALVERVASFDAATRANDMGTVLDALPPKVFEAMAGQFGVTVEQLRAATIEQATQAMASVKIETFTMDTAAASYHELADGMPYVLIPTETVIDTGNGKIKAVSETLGILDAGAWYLMRVEPAQLPTLHQAYPGFAEVTFEPGTMEAVTE